MLVPLIALLIYVLMQTQCATPPVAPHVAAYRVYLPMYLAAPAAAKGIAVSYPEFACGDAWRVHAAWIYTHGYAPPVCLYVESVPMIWGADYIDEPVGGNSGWLMGFNEPDLAGQSSIATDRAAELWYRIEELHPDRQLVAPAPGNYLDGWLEEFYRTYAARYGRAPRLNALAAHCYAVEAATCIAEVEWYKALAAEWHIGEIWVTEFALLACEWSTAEHAVEQMGIFEDYLRSQPTVTRYAYWAARYAGTEPWAFGTDCNTSLFDWQTGRPTNYGEEYLTR